MRCDVMWCDVMWCDVMWCDVMWCDVMWCNVMLCYVTDTISWRGHHDRVMQLNWLIALYLSLDEIRTISAAIQTGFDQVPRPPSLPVPAPELCAARWPGSPRTQLAVSPAWDEAHLFHVIYKCVQLHVYNAVQNNVYICIYIYIYIYC